MGQTAINRGELIVVIPWSEATGRQTREALNVPEGHQTTVTENGATRAIRDDQKVALHEGVYISDIPGWTYGAPAVANRLAIEANYISQLYRQEATFGHDSKIGKWWVYLPLFSLPPGWHQTSTPIIVTVKDNYPSSMPDGFYLSNGLTDVHGRTPSHYFETRSAHNELTAQGWAWFCIHPQSWNPSYDIRDGDSVAKYLTLIHTALSGVVR